MAEEEYKAGDDKDILQRARDELKLCVDEDSDERALMLDDLNFCTLDQWPKDIRNERENDLENGPRPCLTIDKINQYIVQVVNDMRQGKPGINVRPQDDQADVQTAKVLKGIIRNIEDQSSADIAYATAGESAAKIGLGYFRVTTEYLPGSWDQDIFIRPIPNTFSVYLGKHFMPDGSDAKCGFILEAMPVESFKSQYPGKKFKAEEFDGLGTQMTFWHTGESEHGQKHGTSKTFPSGLSASMKRFTSSLMVRPSLRMTTKSGPWRLVQSLRFRLRAPAIGNNFTGQR